MKRTFIFLASVFFLAGIYAQNIKTYKDACIWGHSQRNKGTNGSALSIKDGMTYSMNDVIKHTTPKAIDFMLFYGKQNKIVGFYLFAPGMPVGEINWDKKEGTVPFRYFTASSKDPEGVAWLKNWNVRNATKMHKVEGVDFDRVDGAVIAAIEVKDEYITGALNEGDIVVFETATTSATPNKKGLIKIGAVEDDDERQDKAGQGAFQKMNLKIKVIK
ncbi:MAG: hypothetical protein LBF01_05115 [Bacteroidales bacterium]|jgi:hypothetical protein|nr:hypothetical protein [Bacteroidales bacterium]